MFKHTTKRTSGLLLLIVAVTCSAALLIGLVLGAARLLSSSDVQDAATLFRAIGEVVAALPLGPR